MPSPVFAASELAERFGLELRGEDRQGSGVGTLAGADATQLSFLANPRYRGQLADTAAGVVVLRAEEIEGRALADVSTEDFKALNPSFRKPVIFAAGTPEILLPWDNAKVFRRNMQAFDEGQYASWTVWTVPSTISVAEAAQRVGLGESDLRALNNIPPRMLIKAGSALMVPRGANVRADVAGHVAAVLRDRKRRQCKKNNESRCYDRQHKGTMDHRTSLAGAGVARHLTPIVLATCDSSGRALRPTRL